MYPPKPVYGYDPPPGMGGPPMRGGPPFRGGPPRGYYRGGPPRGGPPMRGGQFRGGPFRGNFRGGPPRGGFRGGPPRWSYFHNNNRYRLKLLLKYYIIKIWHIHSLNFMYINGYPILICWNIIISCEEIGCMIRSPTVNRTTDRKLFPVSLKPQKYSDHCSLKSKSGPKIKVKYF